MPGIGEPRSVYVLAVSVNRYCTCKTWLVFESQQGSFSLLAVRAASLLLLPAAPGWTADEPMVMDKTKEAVQEARRATVENFETLWQRVDERRLKNRMRDEIAV